MMMWFIVWDAYTVVYMYEVTMSRRKGDEKSLVNNVAIKKEWGINLSVASECGKCSLLLNNFSTHSYNYVEEDKHKIFIQKKVTCY